MGGMSSSRELVCCLCYKDLVHLKYSFRSWVYLKNKVVKDDPEIEL